MGEMVHTSNKGICHVVFWVYFWWLTFTYITCELLEDIVPIEDKRIYKYVHYFLEDGFLGRYRIKKFQR